MSYSKAAPRRVSVAERRQKALRLRKFGLTYDQIAKQPRADGDPRPLYSSRRRAWEAVQQALAELRAQSMEEAEDVLALELARLDDLQAGLWPRAARGDDHAVTSVLRIQERRTKYLGLDFADGLEERAVAVSERQAAQVEEALEHALTVIGMTEEQRLEVFEHVADYLKAERPLRGGAAPAEKA